MMNYKLPKSERLHAQKSIKELFNEGSSFFLYPFKVLYLPKKQEGETIQVLFSVSKKKIKKAVDRNLIKRRMKEVYRLNKHSLTISESGLHIGLIYVASEPIDFATISKKVVSILQQISTQVSEHHE